MYAAAPAQFQAERPPGIKHGLAVLWLVGVIGLTYVEFGSEPEPTLYAIMFVSVLIMNTAFAIDVYRAMTSPDSMVAGGSQRA
jgi:hypothetical protein